MNPKSAIADLATANRLHQFSLMDTVVERLAESQAITHLMVRGSFVAGTSDRLSDVDLVVGIRPSDYTRFVAIHDALIDAMVGRILPAWPDTIVPSWGGLGYVYLVHHADMLYQLDLYLAPSGRIPEIGTITRGRLIYENTSHAHIVHAAGVDGDQFIEDQLKQQPTCRQLITELLVLAWLVRKRIVRGQTYMAYKEAHQFTTAARALIRTALSPQSAYLGWYHLEQDLGPTPIGRACLADLADLVNAPPVPTLASLARMVDTALVIAQRAAPAQLGELAPAIDTYRQYLDLR